MFSTYLHAPLSWSCDKVKQFYSEGPQYWGHTSFHETRAFCYSQPIIMTLLLSYKVYIQLMLLVSLAHLICFPIRC